MLTDDLEDVALHMNVALVIFLFLLSQFLSFSL